MARFIYGACLVLALAWLFGSVPVIAWNNHGHMLVAALAYRELSAAPAIKAKVDALIRLNPLIHDWDRRVATLPAGQRPAALFAIAATWPDIIKSDDVHHRADGPNDGNTPPPDASAFANTGYGDSAMHKYWHFVDTAFTTDGSRLPAVPVPNAAERIPVLRMTLAARTTTPAAQLLKSYDLVWLLHLVGDIHQPLHAVTRVSHAQRDGDRGGNLVHLCRAPCRDELHGFWDGALGNDENLSDILRSAMALPVVTGAAAMDFDSTKWAMESFSLARSHVYQPPIGLGAGPFTITAAYRQDAERIATERVALAAARLANLLKTDLR